MFMVFGPSGRDLGPQAPYILDVDVCMQVLGADVFKHLFDDDILVHIVEVHIFIVWIRR